MDVIYRTLPNLKAEHQNIISVNYKLSDLCYWANHEDELRKYLQSLLDSANANIKLVHAFIEFYNGVLVESRDRKGYIADGILRCYDALPDESKQKVCEDLLGRKKFFEDACMKIMDSFNGAVEVKGDEVAEE
ncbi:MAG: hypothetical protein HFG28_16335 [Eubacterium sp.]|nr:hypothetical protein [Eubacterium sp.]